jgi:hypothetical protein
VWAAVIVHKRRKFVHSAAAAELISRLHSFRYASYEPKTSRHFSGHA